MGQVSAVDREMQMSGGIWRLTAVVDEIDDKYLVPSGF